MALIDADILTHIRDLLGDESDTLTETQIYNLSKSRRKQLYYVPLTTYDYLTWFYDEDKGFIEATALSDSYEGDAIDSEDYEADSVAGRWTFSEAQSAVYLNGWLYDFNDIVAWCWAAIGGMYKEDLVVSSLGDESVDKKAKIEFCIQQYWRFRTSKGGRFKRA